jgi:hypothetical protein
MEFDLLVVKNVRNVILFVRSSLDAEAGSQQFHCRQVCPSEQSFRFSQPVRSGRAKSVVCVECGETGW